METLITAILVAGIGYLTIQGFRRAMRGSGCCGSEPAGGCSCGCSPGVCREQPGPERTKK